MRLLIFTPTYADAMVPECAASIRAQTINGDWTWEVGRCNPFPPPSHQNVLAQYQQAQAMFLAGAWDALLTVEHDNVLPDGNAVERLLATPGDVVYGPYVLRHGMFQLSAWQYINDRNLGMPLNNYPEELALAKAAGVWRISGVGMGCTLFRRHVLEQLQFRDGGDGQQFAPDLPFAEDALRAGFVSYGRFDVPVEHIEGDRRLHPYRHVGDMKVVALETVNAIAAGRHVQLVAGQTYSLSQAEVSDLVRVGYIAMQEAPETAAIQPTENMALPGGKRKRAKL